MKEYRNVKVDGDHIEGEQRLGDGGWHRFEARRDLFRIDLACDVGGREACDRIWDVQDGYGEPGFVPAQGWDWSGIRDSSSEAIAEMDGIAREYVPDALLWKTLGVSTIQTRRDELRPGDVFHSSHGYDLLVTRIDDSAKVRTDDRHVGVTGHLHGDPDAPLRTERYPAGSTVPVLVEAAVADLWERLNASTSELKLKGGI